MNFDNARQYLARVISWPQDGDPPFYVNVHWTAESPNVPKPFWSGRATRSVDEAVRAVKWAMTLSETRNIYLCLSTQSQCTSKTSQKGKTYLLPIRNQQNALTLKSLFLDIDVKPGEPKGYPDVGAAVDALKAFITDSGMPSPTMIVQSGTGGMHVYWVMARALTPFEWQPLADALAEATRRHGLKCDTACTVDSARVLRIPDTLNHKRSPPVPVKLVGKVKDFDYNVERLEQALTPYMTPGAQAIPALPPRAPLQGVSDLAAGVEQTKAEPVDLDETAKECGLIHEAITTGGAAFAQPLWNLTTLASVFSKGGRADAHRMADKHPGYTQQSTDDLFDRKEREHQQKNLGWPSCKSFENAGSTHCVTCPHKPAGKSPLAFKPQVVPPVTTQVAGKPLPAGYVYNKVGHICRVLKDESGNDVFDPICDYPITDPWLTKEPWTLHFHTKTPAGGSRLVSVSFEICNTKEGLPRALGKFGLALHERQIKPAREFFVTWLKTLQEVKGAVVTAEAFGWAADEKKGEREGFIYDGTVWTPTGSRPASNADPVLARQYRPIGTMQPWVDAAKMITDQKRPALDAVIASAFAAPLVTFAGREGAFMSVFSPESGIGKTTALKIAQAVWGDPVRGMQGLTDTINSVVGKIAQLRSLPLYWDELKTDEDTQRFVKLVFQLTSGKDKSRMNSDSTLKEVGGWQTMLVSASNESVLDHVAAQSKTNVAGIMRVFEFVVRPAVGTTGQIDPNLAQRLIAKLNLNYGQVGLAYARYLGSYHETLELEFVKFVEEVSKECKFTNDERFWSTVVCCTLFGAKIANRMGLTTIDEKALRAFLYTQVEAMRKTRRDTHVDMKNKDNIVSIMSQFFNEMNVRNTIYTDRIIVARGKPPPNSVKLLTNTANLGPFYVQIGRDNKLVRINLTQLNTWLGKQKLSPKAVTDALHDQFICQLVNAQIGSGTGGAVKQAPDRLLQIDVAGTPLEGLIDDLPEGTP